MFDRLAIRHEAPWRCNRLVPNVVDIVLKHEPKAVSCLGFQTVLPHISRRSEGCFAMKINAGVNALCRQIKLAVAKPCDSRHLRVDHTLNQRRRHRRVNGVAALHQYFRACFSRFGLCGDNDAFFTHGVLRCGRIIRAPREMCLHNLAGLTIDLK